MSLGSWFRRHTARATAPVLGALLALTLATGPALAGQARDRVEAWLQGIAGQVAQHGGQLSWDEVSSSLLGSEIAIHGLRGYDRGGREAFAIATLTIIEPDLTASGSMTADSVRLEATEIAGNHGTKLQAARLEVVKPDLDAFRTIVEAAVSDTTAITGSIVSRLMVDRLDLEDLRFSDPGAKSGETSLRVERLTAKGDGARGLASLEIDNVTLSTLVADADQVGVTVARIRAENLSSDRPLGRTFDKPEDERPLHLLAGLTIGKFEMTGFRSVSSATGTSEIARQWARTQTYTPGRAGILHYGADGMRSWNDDQPSLTAPFLEALFPPDGVMTMKIDGGIAYDVAQGFVGWRQETAVDRFGSFTVQADMSGIPDLTSAEWQTVRDRDPRLAKLQLNALSLAVTDAGGIDRTVLALATDKTVPATTLRTTVAREVGAFIKGMSPKTDPRLRQWLGVVQDFIRLGGTLAVGLTKPIPIGALRDQKLEIDSLTEFADRFGLAVARR